jgi:hypothetical protein
MSRQRKQPSTKEKACQRTNRRLLRALAASVGDPADMLELYYWSKEPGFPQLIRAIATMPECTRAALETFITLAGDLKTVTADLDARGVLIFCSAEAARSAALAMHAVDEAEDRPQLLN